MLIRNNVYASERMFDYHKLAEERQGHWSKMAHDWNLGRAERVLRLEKLLEDAYHEKRKLAAQRR